MWWTYEEYSLFRQQYERTSNQIAPLVVAVHQRSWTEVQQYLQSQEEQLELRRQLAAYLKHSQQTLSAICNEIQIPLHCIAPWMRGHYVGDAQTLLKHVQQFLMTRKFFAEFKEKASSFASGLEDIGTFTVKTLQGQQPMKEPIHEVQTASENRQVVQRPGQQIQLQVKPIQKRQALPSNTCARCLQTGHLARVCPVKGGGDSAKLFIHNLSTSFIDEMKLREYLSTPAKVATLQVFRDKVTHLYSGMAIATYWSADAASKVYDALHLQQFDGSSLEFAFDRYKTFTIIAQQ